MTYATLANIEVEIDDEVNGPLTYNVSFRMTQAPNPGIMWGDNASPPEYAEFEYHQISRRERGKFYPIIGGEYDVVTAHCNEYAYDEMLDIANTQGE